MARNSLHLNNVSPRGFLKDSTMIATSQNARQPGFATDRQRKMHAAAMEVLSNSQYGALRQLTCRVDGDEVEISGTVSSFYLKQLAQAAMLRLRPAGGVRNLIEVSGGRQLAR
jgi:hypothetical protein